MSKNVLLISVDTIKDRTPIHDNVDEKLIYPEIKLAQDMFIHPILGTALYDKLISDIDTTGTTTGAYKTLLDNYIIDTLMYHVLSALPEALSFQFWNKGVVRKVGESTELPSMSELLDISDRYRRKAEWYGERLTLYLKQTASSSVLPEYLSPGDTVDTLIPENSSFTSPIYLGDEMNCQHLDKNNCNCNG
jgi:hypothetical protein